MDPGRKGGEVVTLEEVRKRVESLFAEHTGPNRCGPSLHADEDDLFESVLQAVVDGTCEDPKACAAEALKLVSIRFNRWYE